MSLADLFISDRNLQSYEQAELVRKTEDLYNQRLRERQAAGNIDPEKVQRDAWIASQRINDPLDGALYEAGQGLQDGFNNVLDFPGRAVGAVGNAAERSLWGIVKNVPIWVWVLLLAAGFLYVGGTELIRAVIRNQAKKI